MMQKNLNRNSGFTLIELMITVLIAAILFGIAVPSYRSHVVKAQRTEAVTALLEAASKQEQFFSENRVYTIDPAELGFTPDTASKSKFLTEGGHYSIELSASTGPAAYSLEAARTGSDADITYWLQSNGAKSHKVKSGDIKAGWPDN